MGSGCTQGSLDLPHLPHDTLSLSPDRKGPLARVPESLGRKLGFSPSGWPCISSPRPPPHTVSLPSRVWPFSKWPLWSPRTVFVLLFLLFIIPSACSFLCPKLQEGRVCIFLPLQSACSRLSVIVQRKWGAQVFYGGGGLLGRGSDTKAGSMEGQWCSCSLRWE